MKYTSKNFLIAGLAVAVLGAGFVSTMPAYADAVKDRRQAMKSISKANKVIVAYTKGGKSLGEAVAASKTIASVAGKIPSLFPKGTDRGMLGAKKTRAKAEIWKDWGKFQKAAGNLETAANNFANWSSMGSPSTLASASGAIRKACGGCHKPFRGPKPKK